MVWTVNGTFSSYSLFISIDKWKSQATLLTLVSLQHFTTKSWRGISSKAPSSGNRKCYEKWIENSKKTKVKGLSSLKRIGLRLIFFSLCKYQKGVRNQISLKKLILWHLLSRNDEERSHREHHQDACRSGQFAVQIGFWKFLHTGSIFSSHPSGYRWSMHISMCTWIY